MAAAGPSTMEVDPSQYHSITSTSIMLDEFHSRPNFVNKERLKKQYFCGICSQILLQPYQTPCGSRVCKRCIDDKFGTEAVITCPLPHDDLDADELAEELCQQEGLVRDQVVADPGSQRILLKEKCFCANKPYGCCDTPMWKKLKEHQTSCQYVPQQCPNAGCTQMFAKQDVPAHVSRCGFTVVPCQFCKQSFKQRDLEEHFGDCEFADSQCPECGTKFEKRKQLMVHQKTHPPCVSVAGKCYYIDYCQRECSSVPEMRQHLTEDTAIHLQALTVKVFEMEQVSLKTKELHSTDAKKTVNDKVKPLEKVTAGIAMDVKKLTDKLNASETNGDHLVNAMRTVAHSSQQIESVQTKVGIIERQIKDSGLDRVTVIESHSQNIRRHNELLNEMEKRLKNQELCSYDGTLIWKIADYKRRKGDAIRGRQMSIYSHPFYTSRFGYKMCCRAYLNGDGLGRGKCLSLFFVVMRGEYDELLSFPFKQRVTFSLLCPSNSSLSKHETFMPDPDSSSFRRPQTEMNIASGCPQFAQHSEVESATFLVNDCIYIRVRVELGGDTIP